ncbi:olfactory binding protein S homeolog isoform X1 [Xenopus laevis]|uniref:Olfactory binding protein S homeolog isoform X1 n=1 Tax=Xenopus laevis TaxID=8355 RepID=A0A8J1LK63_XENLA|nr:olfactory binding protein S homeolog isoform X1 [Xenopus laevis]
MLPTVRLVLLSLVFISQMHAADIPVDPDFTVDKLLGEWTGVAAASNSPMFMKKKEQMKTEPVTKYWMDGANLISSTAFRTSKGCKTRKVILKEAEKGRYTYTGKGESRMSIIRITPTLCLEHTITTMPNGNIYFNLKLYSKYPCFTYCLPILLLLKMAINVEIFKRSDPHRETTICSERSYELTIN